MLFTLPAANEMLPLVGPVRRQVPRSWPVFTNPVHLDVKPAIRKLTPNLPEKSAFEQVHQAVCRHPQTLLVAEMAGKPLTQLHGAPLRLHAPTKYGYKQIKRIGLIAYTDLKPDDYWTKVGYDWYAGL
jgi:hypothetical protein